MSLRAASRFSLIGGLAALAAGAYVARWQRPHQEFGEAGVIALLALGFLAAITGSVALLREELPPSPFHAARGRALNRAVWRSLVAPVAAALVIVGFFALADWWTNLNNPVASQVALFAGVLGALVAIVADRVTRWELVLIPTVLLIALIGWGDRLPLDSKTTSRGEIVALLTIVLVIVTIGINIPQVARGRRRPQA